MSDDVRPSLSQNEDPFGGPVYANKDELVDKALVFSIQSITFEPEKGFEGSNRWSLVILVNYDDGGDKSEQILTMGSNPQRDDQFTAAKHLLDNGTPLNEYALVKTGRAYYIRSAR